MGQLIEVEAVRLGAVAIFDTDRSLGGQDGETFKREDGQDSISFSAQAANSIFAADDAATSVYVYSNTLAVHRDGDWSDDAIAVTSSAIKNFLIYYDENRDSGH